MTLIQYCEDEQCIWGKTGDEKLTGDRTAPAPMSTSAWSAVRQGDGDRQGYHGPPMWLEAGTGSSRDTRAVLHASGVHITATRRATTQGESRIVTAIA